MNPHLKYKQNSSLAWTRIDMLLVVYNLTVAALDEGARLIEENRTAELTPVRIRAMRRLVAIADGLDLNQEGLPIQILRLVEFSLEQIRSDSAKAWRAAAEVISTVREGFSEIQDEARNDECEGRIPALTSVG
jgi:flagellar secretion chaperone FliS